MMHSVTDVSDHSVSERVLSNAAHALAGMIAHAGRSATSSPTKPAIGLTMFGVTTPCVQGVTKQLEDRYDCLVFHATGIGGQSMEKLVDSGLLAGVIDATTTEIADEVGGGLLSAGPGRLDAIIRSRIPYVGSCGALDMINFWAMDTCRRATATQAARPQPNVTLMRTTADECRASANSGRQAQSHAGAGPLPDPAGRRVAARRARQAVLGSGADKVLFDVLTAGFRPGTDRNWWSCRTTSTTRRSSTPWSRTSTTSPARASRAPRQHGTPWPASPQGHPRPAARHDRPERADHRRRRRHGLSAKCEEAGGIDLIVIYNSGRYRMAGRGSLAGLLAYGNANEVVLEMAREVLRWSRRRRCWPVSTAPIRS